MAVAKITEKPESASLASSAHVLITQDVSGTETLQRAPLSQLKEEVTSDLKSAMDDLMSLDPIGSREYYHLVHGSCHTIGTSIYQPAESENVVMLQEILTRPSGIQFCFDDTIYQLAYVTLNSDGTSRGYYEWIGNTSPWTEPNPSSTPSYCTIMLRRKDGTAFTGDTGRVLWQEEAIQNPIVAQRQLAESNAAAYTDAQIRGVITATVEPISGEDYRLVLQ